MFESRCGICCNSCKRREDVNCKGCLNMELPFWGGKCGVKACCEGRRLNHCGECPDFPCDMLSSMGVEQGFDPAPKIKQCRIWAAEQPHVSVSVTAAAELEPVLALAWKVFLEFEAPDYSPEGVMEFRRSLDDPAYLSGLRVYGAYEDGAPVGILATRSEGSHIALFFVDGAHHRRGIGRMLFSRACSDCSAERMTVNSSPYAVEVYRHLGFSETDAEQSVNGLRFIPMSRTEKDRNVT